MNFNQLVQRALEIQTSYRAFNHENGHQRWETMEYAQGLVGDVGDLMKLLMAKNGFRNGEDVDAKLAHELSDCLWAIIIISQELGIDLETEFLKTMDELQKRTEYNPSVFNKSL